CGHRQRRAAGDQPGPGQAAQAGGTGEDLVLCGGIADAGGRVHVRVLMRKGPAGLHATAVPTSRSLISRENRGASGVRPDTSPVRPDRAFPYTWRTLQGVADTCAASLARSRIATWFRS